jgi:hypothetical protein
MEKERQAQVAPLLSLHKDLKEELQNLMYYAEEEELYKRENKKGGWSFLEIFLHVNLLNDFYLCQFPASLAKATRPQARGTWVGGQLLKATQKPRGQKSLLPSRAPAAVDPLKKQEKGHALVADVIFRELITDLDSLGQHLAQFPTYAYEELRIQSLAPLVKLNGWDALQLIPYHLQRHLAQARALQQA